MHAIKPSFARSFGRDISVCIAVAALLVSKWCGAAEPTAPAQPVKKCSIVYINGDAVITCKKGG